MLLDRARLAAMLLTAAELWRRHAADLGEIDARFGDGDHGVTMAKIANLLTDRVTAWDGESFHGFLESLGQNIMSIGGGSSGPLYGTLVGGLAEPLAAETEIDGPKLKGMLNAARAGLEEITRARVGDKTMMDALIPAVEAAVASGDEVAEIVAAAARAARQGVKDTERYVSKFGRARNYGDRTIGTPDAGALSTALFFQGWEEGLLGCGNSSFSKQQVGPIGTTERSD